MEDCLEMVDALNALLSPGERELCEELMSSCEVTDFRCFHCPTRCDVELDMLRHCDQAHPYYETKYHLPSSFGCSTPTLMTDECRWMCCACSMLTRSRQDMEEHCVAYHRNSTSRHYFIDRTGLLKMSFTDRSFLQQPPLAPTPPQDSSDILFHDLASSEAELEKLSTQATQMAVMALTHTGDQSTGFTALPPISSLLHPESNVHSAQISYSRQDLFYSTSSSSNSLCYQSSRVDGDQTSDLGSSPSSSTYSEASPVDFNQYGSQATDRFACSSYAPLPKYSAIHTFTDVSCSFEPLRTKIEEQTATSLDGMRCYDESSNSRGFFTNNAASVDDVKAGGKAQPIKKSQSKPIKKAKRSKAAEGRAGPPHQVDNIPNKQSHVTTAAAATRGNKSVTGPRNASTLLKLAGPLSAKRKRFRAALEHVAAPASVKTALEKVSIELHLAVLPAVCSGSSRTVRDLETLLEEHLKTHERAFIHIAGCKLKVRDYASVVDIHPAVQLTDVLRTGIK